MPRPKKYTVDYFPHQCKHSDTMKIVLNKYGMSGRSVWWVLLETLGRTEGHLIHRDDIMKWELFVSETLVPEEQVIEIFDTLAKLGAIDSDLWKNGIVWCQNFVDGIAYVYEKRGVDTPRRPYSVTETPILATETPIPGSGIPRREGKRREEKESKEKKESDVSFSLPSFYHTLEYQDFKKTAVKIIKYLNQKSGKSHPTDKGFGFNIVMSRLGEGYIEDQFVAVINKKLKDPTFNRNYMRPKTLFSEENFETYLYEEEKYYGINGNDTSGSKNNNRKTPVEKGLNLGDGKPYRVDAVF